MTSPRTFLSIACIVWLAAAGFGLRCLWVYENSPGQLATPPATWPTDSTIKRLAGLPSLVVFIHPHCPCSRATIGELAILMAHSQDKVDATAVFVKPAHFDEWEKTDLWTSAKNIPGVKLRVDENGVEAERFQSDTSGQVALYSPDGKLLFNGGITGSRGHFGDNDGLTAIEALLAGNNPTKTNTPVFGCRLIKAPAKTNAEEFCDANDDN